MPTGKSKKKPLKFEVVETKTDSHLADFDLSKAHIEFSIGSMVLAVSFSEKGVKIQSRCLCNGE